MAAVDDVFATALTFCDVENGKQHILRQFCVSELKRLESQLSDGVTVEDCYDALVCAAGMMAAADFSAAYADSGIRSFSAGPISVTKEGAKRTADLRQQAALLMLPWCRGSFRFLGVRG